MQSIQYIKFLLGFYKFLNISSLKIINSHKLKTKKKKLIYQIKILWKSLKCLQSLIFKGSKIQPAAIIVGGGIGECGGGDAGDNTIKGERTTCSIEHRS